MKKLTLDELMTEFCEWSGTLTSRGYDPNHKEYRKRVDGILEKAMKDFPKTEVVKAVTRELNEAEGGWTLDEVKHIAKVLKVKPGKLLID